MSVIAHYQNLYLQLMKKWAHEKQPLWLDSIRESAFGHFYNLGFPTIKQEEWKKTSLTPLAKIPFQPAHKKDLDATFFNKSAFDPLVEFRLVFVDGHYFKTLSSLPAVSMGIEAGNIANLLIDRPQLLEAYLSSAQLFDQNALVALNTALFEDGVYLYVPAKKILTQPIHLLFISTQREEPSFSCPRNLIILGEGSQLTLIESYSGTQTHEDATYFTNTTTQLWVGKHAHLDYYKLENESKAAFHISNLFIFQEKESLTSCHTTTLGGTLTRNNIQVTFHAEGGECTLNGIYLAKNKQHIDNHTLINHVQPRCKSSELYKGIVDAGGEGVFYGKIIVQPHAQKSNANQINKNLLLSDEGTVHSQPLLEIYADDVKCSHGATTGQLDPDALYYFRSRGISEPEARALLTQAFINDLIQEIKIIPLRKKVEKLFFGQLSASTL